MSAWSEWSARLPTACAIAAELSLLLKHVLADLRAHVTLRSVGHWRAGM